MLAYSFSSSEIGGQLVFDNLEDAIEHVRLLMETIDKSNVGNSIEIKVVEMNKRDYERLPESNEL